MRFANKLEFGEKTHEVSMTAIRVVQRMKRDSIHSGRRPSGLCGAALLMAARLHDFNRSPTDIIKIVKVHESTLRKRLIEFGDTPSSALTLDEFMTVDLEEEQDPPAFKAARKKDRERLQKLENIDTEINELQAEIDRQIEEQKIGKVKKRKDDSLSEVEYADKFIKESSLNVIKGYVDYDLDDPNIDETLLEETNNTLLTELGPDLSSMGLNGINERDSITSEKAPTFYENSSGEIHLDDIDEAELDSYIMSGKDTLFKNTLWRKLNTKYLLKLKEKEEQQQREKEEGKPEKKRRRTSKRNKSQNFANTAGEAIEKMLQEKRISSKINYEVLKSLNVTVNGSNNQQQKCEESVVSSSCIAEVSPTTESKLESNTTVSPKNKITPILSSQQSNTIQQKTETKKVYKEPTLIEDCTETTTLSVLDTTDEIDADENDDYMDEEGDADPTEMTVGQMLGRHITTEDNDDFGYGYDEEDYYDE